MIQNEMKFSHVYLDCAVNFTDLMEIQNWNTEKVESSHEM